MKYWTDKGPVRLRQRWRRRDSQLDAPWGWCVRCGAEVWQREEWLCEDCR